MKTYEQAKKIAVKNNDSVNACREYKEAYVFYNKKATGDGGESSPVVVMKSNGQATTMSRFMRNRKESDAGKAIAFTPRTTKK